MNSQEAYELQQKNIALLKEKNPDLLAPGKARDEQDVFQEIGMHHMPQDRTRGYLRLFPEDFIVEEITQKDTVVRINDPSTIVVGERDAKNRTLWFDLIKIGIPTNIALRQISEAFDIPENKIGYAGLKDSDAITAQKIAFSKMPLTPEEVYTKKFKNIFLSHPSWGNGSLNRGSLNANRFTITVRTENAIENDTFQKVIDHISDHGILNYYQAQRFGGQRLMTHKFGKLIAQGYHTAALRQFLFHTSEYESAFVQKTRQEAKSVAPDWKTVQKIFMQFPYTFGHELRAVEYLLSSPDNHIGALIAIKDQVLIWSYAYASLLFNRYISEHHDNLPEKIPLLLTNNRHETKIYNTYLAEDQTKEFRTNLSDFKFIVLRSRKGPTKVYPKKIRHQMFNGGVVIQFDLPKGSYATTFLSHLFSITQDVVLPEWLTTTSIDPKELMNDGSLTEIKKIFGENFYYKDIHKELLK